MRPPDSLMSVRARLDCGTDSWPEVDFCSGDIEGAGASDSTGGSSAGTGPRPSVSRHCGQWPNGALDWISTPHVRHFPGSGIYFLSAPAPPPISYKSKNCKRSQRKCRLYAEF